MTAPAFYTVHAFGDAPEEDDDGIRVFTNPGEAAEAGKAFLAEWRQHCAESHGHVEPGAWVQVIGSAHDPREGGGGPGDAWQEAYVVDWGGGDVRLVATREQPPLTPTGLVADARDAIRAALEPVALELSVCLDGVELVRTVEELVDGDDAHNAACERRVLDAAYEVKELNPDSVVTVLLAPRGAS